MASAAFSSVMRGGVGGRTANGSKKFCLQDKRTGCRQPNAPEKTCNEHEREDVEQSPSDPGEVETGVLFRCMRTAVGGRIGQVWCVLVESIVSSVDYRPKHEEDGEKRDRRTPYTHVSLMYQKLCVDPISFEQDQKDQVGHFSETCNRYSEYNHAELLRINMSLIFGLCGTKIGICTPNETQGYVYGWIRR